VVNKIHLVHASPQEPTRWHYILNERAAGGALDASRANLCFVGHTHLPVIYSRTEDGVIRKRLGHDFLPDPEVKYIVNTGSVGQPRDNDPRACYLIFDSEEYEVCYRRIEYDIALAQEKMTQAEAAPLLVERIAVGR
jgi:diadenosine tetraphosphatase ApaH/serine/threonine PP2A family protein phosphatase